MTTVAAGVLQLERRIAARPETVFSFFTDPARYRLWQGVDAELDPRPGGIFRVTMTGRSHTVARGVFVEVEPPRRIVFTWGWERLDALPEGMQEVLPGSSTVEVVLAPDGEGTLLTLRHSGLPTQAAGEFHSYGWNLSLARLLAVAAGEDPGQNPFAEA
jgi:uncharacterized protein YndB with AHSA1/START domain